MRSCSSCRPAPIADHSPPIASGSPLALGKTEGMERTELAGRIREVCSLEGEFLLRSGQRSSLYFDKYLFEADPELLQAAAQHLAAKVSSQVEVLAGLELGGIPLVVALSR